MTRHPRISSLVGLAYCLATLASSASLQQPLGDSNTAYPRLNFSSPSPLIFHSVFGLLQQWPNTFFPNGHTVAPCLVASGTSLYHGRRGENLPPSPEWLAFDAEYSYAMAGAGESSVLLTYRLTRAVPCLYFDGASASLADDGAMDVQELVIHKDSAHVPDQSRLGRLSHSATAPVSSLREEKDRPRWDPLNAEYNRASGLCDMIEQHGLGGAGWGYEGIVRMNAGFEMIWCNFSSPSLKVVSRIKTTVPSLEGVIDRPGPERPPRPHLHDARGPPDAQGPPDGFRPSDGYGPPDRYGPPGRHDGPYGDPFAGNPFTQSGVYDWFRAATDRYGFAGSMPGRGEARVTVDSTSLVTYYDPALRDQARVRIQQEQNLYNLTEDGYWQPPAAATDRQAALEKLRRRRRTQHLRNVSSEDGFFAHSAVLGRLKDSADRSLKDRSHFDWVSAAQEIVLTHSDSLNNLQQSLKAALLEDRLQAIRERVAAMRNKLHHRWMAFYEHPPFRYQNISQAFSNSAPQSLAALNRCAKAYAREDTDLSESEQTTHHAFNEVLHAICSKVLSPYLSIEEIWLKHFNNVSAPLDDHDHTLVRNIHSMMTTELFAIEELMAWLGWVDQWTSCSPSCSSGQQCYIPMWPAMGRAPGRGPGRRHDRNGTYPGPADLDAEVDKLLWQPQCVDAEHFPPDDNQSLRYTS